MARVKSTMRRSTDNPKKIITKCRVCNISKPGFQLFALGRDESCVPMHVDYTRREAAAAWKNPRTKIDHDIGEVVQANFLFETVKYNVMYYDTHVGYEYAFKFKLGSNVQKALAADTYNITKTYIWRANRHELALSILYQYRFRSQYLFFVKYLRDEYNMCSDVTTLILRLLVDSSVNSGKNTIVY